MSGREVRGHQPGTAHTGVGSLRAMAEQARSESGLPIEAGLRTGRPCRLRPGDRSWASRASSRSPGASTRRCTPAGPGRCGSTPGSAPPRSPTQRYHQLIDARHRPACRSPSTCRPRWATTPTHPIAHGEVGKVGVAIDSIDDMRIAVRRDPAGRGLHLDDDQRARPRCCCCSTSWSAEEQGVAGDQLTGTIQNDVLKEYIARGTYIYPPQPSLRLITDIFAYCRDGAAALEHDLDLRLPHGRGRGDAGAGDRVHARRRHRVRPGGARRPAWTSTTSRRGCRSSSSPARRCSRRSRSSAPPGGSGRGSCATSSARKNPKSLMLRFHTQTAGRAADRAAARGQPGPRRGPGPRPRCSAAPSRCTPTPSTRRSRCPTEKAARLALRTQQVHRLRDRRHRRPSTRSPAPTPSSR